MPKLPEKESIAISSHYDRRTDTTIHKVLHIVDNRPHSNDDIEMIVFSWPFQGEHKLSVTDIIWLNKIAIRLIKKEK